MALGSRTQSFDYSCEHYSNTGRMMPEDALTRLRDFDSVFLGAVGYPGVPDHVSLWGTCSSPYGAAFSSTSTCVR